MHAYDDKIQESKNQPAANGFSLKEPSFNFIDNRPSAVAQGKLMDIANNSQRVLQLKALQETAEKSPGMQKLNAFQEMANSSPRVKNTTQLQVMSVNNVVQLKLSRENAVALRIYTKDKYDDNDAISAEELQGIHEGAVKRCDTLQEAKEFFDKIAGEIITNKLRPQYAPLLKIMAIRFRDGVDRARSDLFEVLINLLLVQQGIRPAFLLQWVDYNSVYRQEIKELIFKVIDNFFSEGTFALKEIDQGLLVIDTHKIKWVKQLIDRYQKEGPDASKALGMALGYPAAGEIDSRGQRYSAHIITPDGGDVMSNICDSVASVRRFEEFYHSVNAISRNVLGISLKFVVNRL